MKLQDLDTPSIVIDLPTMESNLKRMADYCRNQGLNLRPHTKTHKCPEIAKLQVAQGFPGITCAKVGEAEVMVEAGLKDILIAYPIVGEQKVERLCKLARKSKIAVSVDSAFVAKGISREANRRGVTIDILAEYNLGMNRVGVDSLKELLKLAETISSFKGLRLRGIGCYPGQIFCKPAQQIAPLREMGRKLLEARAAFVKKGFDDRWVSGGSTPSAYQSHHMPGLTEIRPGMYLFNDRNLLKAEICTPSQVALHVLTTVVSTSVHGKAMMDGGSKTFSGDRSHPAEPHKPPTFGIITEDPKINFYTMSEEHGHLNVEKARKPLKVGQRLKVIPNHVCPVVNLHNQMYGIRKGRVEKIFEVKGRGKVQ